MIKKLLLFILHFTFCIFNCFPQAPFQKTYGGTGGESAADIKRTRDGGYIVAGWTASFGSMQDAYLIKINRFGDTLWTHTYSGAANEYFRSVTQTSDDGFIATGSTNSGLPDNDLLLVKTDSLGNAMWMKTYKGSTEEIGNDVQQTVDGGYIITGNYALVSLYLIRTDSVGDTLWTKTVNGATGWSVVETPDSGFAVGGQILAAGPEAMDFYLIKTNSAGDTLWTRIYGDTASETGKEMKRTQDGGYILCGSTTSFGAGGSDAYVVKTNGLGIVQWSKAYGGTGNEVANSIAQTTDGGYIVTGNTNSFGAGANDVYLLRIDSAGTLLWSYAYGSSAAETGNRVIPAIGGGFIIAAQTSGFGAGATDAYLIKTDSLGNTNCNRLNAATITTTTPTRALIFPKVLGRGAVVSTPAFFSNSGCTINTLCSTLGISKENGTEAGSIVIFPNPFSAQLSIHSEENTSGFITLSDLSGKILLQQKTSTSETKLNTEGIAAGFYLLRVEGGRGVSNFKVVKSQ